MKTANVLQWKSTQFFPDFQVKLMISLRSKRFRLVSEQRKTENGSFGFGRASLLFDSRHFRRGFLLSSPVLCSEAARKPLLRRLTDGGKDKRAPPCLLLPAQPISLATTSSSPPFHAGFVKAARKNISSIINATMQQWLNFKAMASSGLPVRTIYIGRYRLTALRPSILSTCIEKNIYNWKVIAKDKVECILKCKLLINKV